MVVRSSCSSSRPVRLSTRALLGAALCAAGCNGGSGGSGGSGGTTTSATGGATTTTTSDTGTTTSGGAGGATGGTSTGGTGGVPTGGTGGVTGTTTSTTSTTTSSTTGPVGFGAWHPGWVVSWPCSGQDFATGKLGGGGATVAGRFTGTITFPLTQATSANGFSSYVVRIGPTGQLTWVNILTATMGVGIQSVDVDANGRVVVAGNFAGSLTIGATTLTSPGVSYGFVAVYDTNGAPLWARSLGFPALSVDTEGVTFTPDGNLVVGGSYFDHLDLDGVTLASGEGDDIFVAKLSGANGTRLWAKTFGYLQSAFLDNVSADPAGDIILSGDYQDAIDFGVGPLLSPVVGTWRYVVKLSGADGTTVVSRSAQKAYGFGTAAPDGFYFVGSLWGAADFGAGVVSTNNLLPVVVKYDPTGAVQWVQTHGDAATLNPSEGLPSASSGGVAAPYAIQGSVDFGDGLVACSGGYDVFLEAFPAGGMSPKTLHYGSPTDESPRSFALGSAGDALVVGSFSGTLDFGPVDIGSGVIAPQLAPDTFVLYLAAD